MKILQRVSRRVFIGMQSCDEASTGRRLLVVMSVFPGSAKGSLAHDLLHRRLFRCKDWCCHQQELEHSAPTFMMHFAAQLQIAHCLCGVADGLTRTCEEGMSHGMRMSANICVDVPVTGGRLAQYWIVGILLKFYRRIPRQRLD